LRLVQLLHSARNLGAFLMALVCVGAAVLYPWIATLLSDAEIARATWPVVAILLAGAFVYGSYAALGGIFSQCGFPARQSEVNLVILAFNLSLNILLVPFYGVIGAAAATALSFAMGAQYFRWRVCRQFGFRV